MMFELKTAWRFLIDGKFQTVLILFGIALGVAVQIFLSALIGGLQKDLIDKTVGASPHITGRTPEKVVKPVIRDSVPVISTVAGIEGDDRPVRAWEPVVKQLKSSGLFKVVAAVANGSGFLFKGERSRPVVLRGVDISDADKIYKLKAGIRRGDMALTSTSIIIGTKLAEQLRLTPGSTVRLLTSQGGGDLFTVQGIFDLQSGMINETWVFIDRQRAQKLFDFSGGISALELQVRNVFDAELSSGFLNKTFGQFKWVSWQENNASLLTALRSQSSSSNIIQFMVFVAVTMGISSVLAVSVVQKSKQIGILKAIGATRSSISRVFLIMGALLGLGGALTGCFAGFGIVSLFTFGTSRATGTPLFPIEIKFSLYLLSIFIATFSGIIAASIPARKSASMNPVEAIRG